MTGSVLNFIIKIIAVALAILLWFNVITEKDYEYQYTLPVTDIELPAALAATTPFPDSLTVTVNAEGKKLLADDWKEAGLRLKAGRLKRGSDTLDLNMETVALVRSEDITLVDIIGAPALYVYLDRLDSLLVPVASRLAVVPEEGYVVVKERGSISPLQTRVVGPAMLIRRLDTIYTESKILEDVNESVSLRLALHQPVDSTRSLGHDSADVEIVIDKLVQKKFERVPVFAQSGRSNRRPIVEPDHIAITIEGPQKLLDSLNINQIRIHASLPTGDSVAFVPPTIMIPINFTVVGTTPDSIHIARQ
jgi:hypothetical protein